jgi:Xaa-Pro aminopeptidase
MVVTALDELAWLFNLRGKDLPYTPFFKGYCVLTKFHTLLYIHKDRQTDEIKVSLKKIIVSSSVAGTKPL